MVKKIFYLFICLVSAGYFANAQNSQLQLARNSVGKLQASVEQKEDKGKQLGIIKEGIKAIETAKKNKKTSKFSETWAINAYLNAYSALITDNAEESEKYYNTAVIALDTAKLLDKEQVNIALINATQNNINIKRLEKGNNAFVQKDFSEAYQVLSGLSDSYTQDTTLALNVAIAAQYIQRNDEAFKYFKRAADNGILNPAVYQNLSRLYASNQENDAAIKALETGIALNAGNNALKNDYINILLDNNRYDKALSAIETALKVNQNNERLFFLYGYLHQNQRNVAKAESAYKRAIALNSNYFDAFYQLGLLYIDMANRPVAGYSKEAAFMAERNAESVLLKAYDIKPNDKNILRLLIEINKKRNRPDRVAELERRLNEL